MATKTETKEIGDNEYSVTQWSAEKAILTKLKLVKTFGASLALLGSEDTSSSKKTKTKNKDNAELLSSGIQILFEGNSPEEITALIKGCVIGAACNGKKITESSFTEIFSGDGLMEVYQVFFFVLKVNYSDLMKGQMVEGLLAKVQENL